MLEIPKLQTLNLPSKQCLLLDPIREKFTSIRNNIFAQKCSTFEFWVYHSQLNQTQHMICARTNRNGRDSDRLGKIFLKLIPIIASKAKMLPQPLDLVIQEIVGGDGGRGGGGLGFQNGYGWGGFGGRRRRRKSDFWFYGFWALCGLGLLIGMEMKNNVLSWAFGLSPFLIFLIQWRKWRGIQGWILGFFFWGFLLGLGFKREELKKYVERFSFFPPLAVTRRSCRGGRKGARTF